MAAGRDSKGDTIMITLGSLFSGIGGFELGLERAIPGLETIWQVEQEKFCKKVLNKHWPNAEIFDDVKTVGKHNLKPVDIICGGFPCQDISTAGKQGGIYAEKSGLWWEFHRIISELQPRIAVMENVPNLLTLGLPEVLGSLSKIGYNAEWCIVSASQFGAPHLRRRIFIIAYSSSKQSRSKKSISAGGISSNVQDTGKAPYGSTYWEKAQAPSSICYLDDGIPDRLAKLRSLGNAIVPQCSEWIGKQILNSGLLNDLSRA